MRQFTSLILALSCATNALAGEFYRNPEYLFAIRLASHEHICQADSHGVAISTGTEGCNANEGYQPVNITAEYNAELEPQFPTTFMRDSCGGVSLERTKITLGTHAWYSCELRHHGGVHVFFYNVVRTNLIVKWRFFNVEVKMSAQKYSAHKDEIRNIVRHVHLVHG